MLQRSQRGAGLNGLLNTVTHGVTNVNLLSIRVDPANPTVTMLSPVSFPSLAKWWLSELVIAVLTGDGQVKRSLLSDCYHWCRLVTYCNTGSSGPDTGVSGGFKSVRFVDTLQGILQ